MGHTVPDHVTDLSLFVSSGALKLKGANMAYQIGKTKKNVIAQLDYVISLQVYRTSAQSVLTPSVRTSALQKTVFGMAIDTVARVW